MSQLNWAGLLMFVGSFLGGVVGFLVFGPAGFFIGLVGTMFVGFPLKSIHEDRQSRITMLEERVAELESTVERPEMDESSGDDD